MKHQVNSDSRVFDQYKVRGHLGGPGRCGAEGLVALLADQIGDEVRGRAGPGG